MEHAYLVDCYRANFEVLLPDKHFNGPLMREVVLEQILALPALELTADTVKSARSYSAIDCTYPHSGSADL